MISKHIMQITGIMMGAVLIVLGGCAGTSPPANFYVLSPLPDSAAGTQPAGDESSIAIGIGPVNLPDYLDRSQIVTRVSPNALKVAAFDRWAEPLKSSFPRVLMENLAILLKTDQVTVYPWRKAIPVTYQVVVDVVRFDASPGENAVLVARWSLFSRGGDKLHVMKKSTFTKTTGSNNYEAMVSAQSQTIIEFSREIAAAIKTIAQ
ncbi:MAG: PqiC family protein [Planctomycetota bacterium]